jgi:selenocysteine-specific translation elongation factor
MVIIIGAILLGIRLFSPRVIMNDSQNETTNMIAPRASEGGTVEAPGYYPMPYQNNPTINDTREFLKMSYSAEIKTRNVPDTVGYIESAVRNVDGRIDGSEENSENGYVSFVIPKSNLENFRAEIANFTNKKLIIENTSSENLLSQKQSIEAENTAANDSLATLKREQQDLLAKHYETLINLQNNITDPNLLSQSISEENSNFNAQNQNLKYQINNVNTQLKNIAQEDTNFTNNIETVNGSISVSWISLWQLATIFSPISPLIIIIVLVIILWLIFRKKSYIPKIEFV